MKQLTENTLLFLILSLGALGLAFNYFSTSTTSTVDVTMSNSSISEVYQNFTNGDLLQIGGSHEVGLPLSFNIDGYAANATYTLETGDGKTKQLDNGQLSHIYSSPGKYKVKLHVTYQGETKLACSKKIVISEQLASM